MAKLVTSDSNFNDIHYFKKKESPIRESANDKSLSLLIFLVILLLTFVGISETKENDEDFSVLSAQSMKLSGYTQRSYTLGDDSKKGFGSEVPKFVEIAKEMTKTLKELGPNLYKS